MYEVYTDCPKCGKEGSSYDGCFCGECEEKYQREQEEFRLEAIKHLEDKCKACLEKMGGECDWGMECRTRIRIDELEHPNRN